MGTVSGKRQWTGCASWPAESWPPPVVLTDGLPLGEIVPRDYVREVMRIHFMVVFWWTAPDARALILEGASGETQRQYFLDTAGEWIPKLQETYRLSDPWVGDHLSFIFGLVSLDQGREGAPATPRDVFWWRLDPQRWASIVSRFPVALDDLRMNGECCNESPVARKNDPIGSFDPRRETIDQATARIMPELEQRLRHALGAIKEADESNGDNIPTQRLPARQYFEWTVRYQCLGETIRTIAESAGVEQKTVSSNIRKVAGLIGLTLREPDKGGRPKRTRTRITRHTHT